MKPGSIALLLFLLVFPSELFAVKILTLEAPQDDLAIRWTRPDRGEVKPISVEYRELIRTRIWPLTPKDAAAIFGAPLEQVPGC
jgi:hypothetical protein